MQVAYKMLETQQASLSQPNSNASLESGAQDDGTADPDGVAGKENEDVSLLLVGRGSLGRVKRNKA